uniref:CCHC-type domain-containing protein n=1 Tax=Meloidogyne enterolobii TaxID=390850 RepID=A0A6V7U2V2_MELEN|nr:unnamed protein product [Meloidogyne enterolobii]
MRFVETKKKQALPVSLKEVIEECRLYLANKAEAVMIAVKPTVVKEHAVKVNWVKAENEQPPKEVKEKEEKWKTERQWLPKQVQCEFCGKKGHVKQDCWHYKSPYCGVGEICDPSENFKVQEWIKKKVKVNGHQLEMIIDSGSQINAVTPEVWEDIGSPKLEPVIYKGKGFGDKDFEIEGKWKCILEIEDKNLIVEMHVVKGSKNIIGLPVLHKFSEEEVVKSSKKKKNKVHQGSVQKRNAFSNGTKVTIKNTNNRTGKIEWLKGEVIRKTFNAWKVKVPILKSIVTRTHKEIRKDTYSDNKKKLSDDLENLVIIESISGSAISSSNSNKEACNGTKAKMKEFEDNKMQT